MDDIYKNIDEYNPNNSIKKLILFNDMIADMLSNKKPIPIVTELFIRGRKLNISLLFITQSYFAAPKNIRLNSTHYFVMKITNKREDPFLNPDKTIKKIINTADELSKKVSLYDILEHVNFTKLFYRLLKRHLEQE